MSQLDAAMRAALASKPDVAALACMDGNLGLVLGVYVKGDVPRDVVEMAALAGPHLCSTPSLAESEEEEEPCPEAFVSSDAWVHAFARVPEQPALVVVGVAHRGANVTLLRAWLGEVAGKAFRAS